MARLKPPVILGSTGLALMIASSAVYADHDCCEFAPPQGCASMPGLPAATCNDLGGVFMADMECSLTTGNCQPKTGPAPAVCCAEDCVNDQSPDPLGECGVFDTIVAGQDCFTTPCGGGTVFDFGAGDIPAIPPGFFGLGSDPFMGPVDFGGPGGFPGDTLIQRLADADVSSGPATVPIQIMQLDLVSCQPITVTFNGGMNPQQWDVQIQLDGPQNPGQMTIFKTSPDGGVFDSILPVRPLFIFTEVGNPTNQQTLQPMIETVLQADLVPWRFDTIPGITCSPGFSPTLCSMDAATFIPCCVISCHNNPNDPTHPHCVLMPDCKPCPADPPPFCPPPPGDIPAASQWGMVVMVLIVLTAGTIVFTRRREIIATAAEGVDSRQP